MTDFLTIDLDYFTMTKCQNATQFLLNWMHKAPEVYLIDTHEKIVEYNLIPKHTKRVFNVDFHNDITANVDDPACGELDLNEGTWGNYLDKNVKQFIWMYPVESRCVVQQMGICIPSSKNSSDYPLQYKKQKGYSNIPEIINRLVICISAYWGDPSKIMNDLNITNWHKIKHRRIK